MAKKNLFIIINILFFITSYSQSNSRYEIKNLGYILVPEELEVRSIKKNSSMQKELSKTGRDNILKNDFVVQQKGYNENIKAAFDTYVRFIIDTEIGDFGDYPKLNIKISLSLEEYRLLNEAIYFNIENNYKKFGHKIINWNYAEITKMNNYYPLKVSFIRQLDSHPHVEVLIYKFFNNDRIHTVTISYRLKEAIKWKPLLLKMLSSLVITNIR